jgi:hypothetical protein
MPLGFERINERVKRPNDLINFIRPLPGRTQTFAQDFLERVAAISYPIMKRNHIAVMALEEYAWNPEFIGRNFNAGEVIQLVLRSKSGAWLPFRHVQMVMMHELAHCKQMNHSKAFWGVRDAYAGELRGLWDKNYTGEGFWGRGKTVWSGEHTKNAMPTAADLPEHMCGGTFRRRRRKRKRASKDTPKVTYAERQQRRILKKFGTGGTALGDDEAARVKLEEGKKKAKGKPRVAGSARGRELRAAAALARFETTKTEEVKEEEESDTDSDYDWPLTDDEAVGDQGGNKVQDGNGHDMVRVCEVEDQDDVNVKREIEELIGIDSYIPMAPPRADGCHSNHQIKHEDEDLPELTLTDAPRNTPSEPKRIKVKQPPKKRPRQRPENDDESSTASEVDYLPELTFGRGLSKKVDHNASAFTSQPALRPQSPAKQEKPTKAASKLSFTAVREPFDAKSLPTVAKKKKTKDEGEGASETQHICVCCSFVNESCAVVCVTCSNVLNTRAMPNHWRCQSLACRGGEYINMGDYGICQVCGAKKPSG